MAKTSEEIARLRGERVKALLKRYKWTQTRLAKELNIQATVLNAKLNGPRTINEGDAIQIANLFPPVKVGWIMGVDRFPTQGEEMQGVLDQARQEGHLLNVGFGAFATLIGYSVTPPQLPETAHVNTMISILNQGYTLSKDGKTVSLSIVEMNRLQNRICDHIETELKYLFQEKGD